MVLGEFDRSGRRRPEGESGNDFQMETDQIITAIGQKVNLDEVFNGIELEINESKMLVVNRKNGQTSIPWVFAGGDAVSGPSSVIEAVAAGERAAVGIDEFLTGESHGFWRQVQEVHTSYDPESDPVPYPREKMHLISVDRRRNNFDEVEMSWNESVAIRQAKRCLRCDYGKKGEIHCSGR
jgi:NADH-quinone oxidoreductase subunit F